MVQQIDTGTALVEGLRFDEDDLEANRNGVLSPLQQAALKSDLLRWLTVAIALSPLLLEAVPATIRSICDLPVFQQTGAIGYFVVAAGIFVFVSIFLYLLFRFMRDIQNARVRVAVGPIRPAPFTVLTWSRQIVAVIGEVRVSIPHRAYEHLRQHSACTVYYLPRTKRVVSAVAPDPVTAS